MDTCLRGAVFLLLWRKKPIDVLNFGKVLIPNSPLSFFKALEIKSLSLNKYFSKIKNVNILRFSLISNF